MRRWRIRGIAAGSLLLLMAAAGCAVAPVYYLNDDVTMRGILSGACTGTADGHAVYMKYPLTGLLAGLYRLSERLGLWIPWFDLFLAGCILLAGAGILWGCLESFRGRAFGIRMGWTLVGALFLAGLLLPQYLYMHYTIVAALLAGGALFLWETGEDRRVPILLLALCYQVRNQVFFLTLPFLLVAALDVLLRDTVSGGRTEEGAQDAKRWRDRLREPVRRQGAPLLALAATIALFGGIDGLAYRDAGWQSYRAYNEGRTDLYDYTDFLSTDRYGADPGLLDLDEGQYQTLAHYDIILDKRIDARLLRQTAERIEEGKAETGTGAYLMQCLKAYYLHIRYDGRPYSLIWAGCYGILVLLLAGRRRWIGMLSPAALALGRSLIWVYLIARGRFPERIWVSLYLIEICLLLCMILRECAARPSQDGPKERWVQAAALILCLLMTGSVVPVQLRDTVQRVAQQQERQDQWTLLTDSLDGQYFYLTDVYSAVAFAGEVYGRDDGRIMLLGGWLAQSPLVERRLAAYGAEDGAEALRHGQVRLLAESGRDIAWLEEYLAGRLGAAELQPQETIVCGEDLAYTVYRLTEPGGSPADGD